MNKDTLIKHRVLNVMQSIALTALLSLLLGYLALIVAGKTFALISFVSVISIYLFNQFITSNLILRVYNGTELNHFNSPELFRILQALSNRAGLKRVPRLYLLPDRNMNAFSTGAPGNSIIALSDGLLKQLSVKETAGVLGHEISHIKNNDIGVLSFADISNRMTKVLSLIGQILLLLNLPLLLFTDFRIDWLPIVLLIVAPLFSNLIQLALSRVREFNADLGAAILLGDPEPLASALSKMNPCCNDYFETIFFPRKRTDESSLFRTHPSTDERIRRLLQMRKTKSYVNNVWGRTLYPNMELMNHFNILSVT